MGYFSCNAESAVTTCDRYNWDTKIKHKKRTNSLKHHDLRRFSYDDLHSGTAGFSPDTFLGKGSHGSVYKAVLDDGKLVVAVKKTKATTKFLREGNNNHCRGTAVDNEIEILSRIRNHRLVNLLGFSLDSKGNKLIVVEFMPNGSLYDLLHSNPRPPCWAMRVSLALQTAMAVEALHSSNPPIIHRDIKSSNVLIDGNWNARLGDFGLALRGHVEDVRIKCTPPAGTLGYLDPGYITPENLSTKSDVFSFGILLLEIISGRNAIDLNYSPPSVVDWALPLIKQIEFNSLYDPRIGPPEEPSVMRQLAVLAARCVRSGAEKRPSMAEVVDCLRAVRRKVRSPMWNNFRRRMRKPCSSIEHEGFDLSEEAVKASKHGVRGMSLRSRKVSSVQPSLDFEGEANGIDGDRSGRSKSIGSISEMKWGYDANPIINHGVIVQRKSGLPVRRATVRLRKSRSMGMLQMTRQVHDHERVLFQLVRNSCLKGVDASRLAVSADKDPAKKIANE